MKLNGPISYSCLDDGKEEEETQASEISPAAARIVVGYALTSKKKKSFLKPKLIRLARYSFNVFSFFVICLYAYRCASVCVHAVTH